MKTILYCTVLLAALLIPKRSTDVGCLCPIEVMMVSCEADRIRIITDTGDLGEGESVKEAMVNLCDTAAGIVYPDLAEYLILANCDVTHLQGIDAWVYPKTKICKTDSAIELEGAIEYLNTHEPSVTLRGAMKGAQPEMLIKESGRWMLKNRKT